MPPTADLFQKLLDKATCKSLEECDWEAIVHICDLVGQGDVGLKFVMTALKQKLFSTNASVAMQALVVLDMLVKNSASEFLEELAQKPNCEMLHYLSKTTKHESVRQTLLEFMQVWTSVLGKDQRYNTFKETVDIMTTEQQDDCVGGDKQNQVAKICDKCRALFRLVGDKHLCRGCSRFFCNKCITITQDPAVVIQLGVDKKDIFCDACYDKGPATPPTNKTLPPASSENVSGQCEDELDEKEQLDLALALSLSQSEAEAREDQTRASMSADLSSQDTLAIFENLQITEKLKEVQNELTCGICFSYFEEATTLCCSHSFCCKCINSWQRERNECPVCREKIAGMTRSRALDNMVAAVTKKAIPDTGTAT